MKNDVSLVKFDEENLKEIWKIGFRKDLPEWKKWDGPYFDDDYKKCDTYEKFLANEARFFLSTGRACILYKNRAVGLLTMYWEDKKTRWLNIGITIYDDRLWGKGIGSKALRLWIEYIFNNIENLEHVGLVTWSGNKRMIELSKKIGLKKEGQIRKVRFYKGKFYDSISYGILKDEWLVNK